MKQVFRKFNIEFCKEKSRLDNIYIYIQDVSTRIDVLNTKDIEKKKKKLSNKSNLKKFHVNKFG